MMADFALQWHITQRCNNNCRHCYMEDTSHILSFDTYKTCIDNIENFEKKYKFEISTITLTGGDPFLNPSWHKIARDLVMRNKKIAFLGNPECLNDDTLNVLSELGIVRYQLSLDGLEASHDKIRYCGSFKKTIDAIQNLYTKNIPIAIMYTLSNNNYYDLKDLILFLDNLDIPVLFSFDFVINIGNAKKNSLKTSINLSNLFREYLDLKSKLISKKSKVVLTEKPSLLFAFKNYFNMDNRVIQHIPYTFCGGCGAGWRHLTIINDGDVLACRRMPAKVGNLLKDSFEDILLKSPFLIKLRKRSEAGQCSSCLFYRFCRGCPAETYASHGVPFDSELNCAWYKKDESIDEYDSMSEYEKILHSINNQEIASNKIDMDKITKSLILFNLTKQEKEFFMNNPHEWSTRRKFNLNIYEIGYLYCFLMNYFC